MDLAFSSVILYTFSGTGNTTKVAQMIKTNFETKGIECRLVEIGKLETLPAPWRGPRWHWIPHPRFQCPYSPYEGHALSKREPWFSKMFHL